MCWVGVGGGQAIAIPKLPCYHVLAQIAQCPHPNMAVQESRGKEHVLKNYPTAALGTNTRVVQLFEPVRLTLNVTHVDIGQTTLSVRVWAGTPLFVR